MDLLYELCDILITGITGRAVMADRRMEGDELVDDDMLYGTSPIVAIDGHQQDTLDRDYLARASLITSLSVKPGMTGRPRSEGFTIWFESMGTVIFPKSSSKVSLPFL